MSLTWKGEKPATRRAQNMKGVRTYQRVYLIESDSKSDGEYAVGSHPNLPLVGSPHPEDPFAWCVGLTVLCTNGYKAWEVTADWSSEFAMSEIPTNDAARIFWGSQKFPVPLDRDRNGEAVLNSAGDPFDPPLTRDSSRTVCTIEKNVSSVPSWILSYKDRVNQSAFTVDGVTVAQGNAKIDDVRVGPEEYRNNIQFRSVSIVMHIDDNGWNFEPVDRGFRQLNDDGDPVDIVNKGDQSPVTVPALLDGTGYAIDNPQPSDAVFLDIDGYPTADFSVLPLT